jgi:hypothetical protein
VLCVFAATFNAFVTSGTVVNNYAHIFDLLIRLRQAVNHPWLVEYSATRMLSLEQQNEDDDDDDDDGGAGGGSAGAAAAAARKPALADTVCGICAEECGGGGGDGEDDDAGVDGNGDGNGDEGDGGGGLQSVRAACGHLFCRGCLQVRAVSIRQHP